MAGSLARTFCIKADRPVNKVSLSYHSKRTVFARSRGRIPSGDPDENKVLLSHFDEDHGSIATSAEEIMPAIFEAVGESSRPCRYDVFLSFRGQDTRKGFVGHLHAALERGGIAAFMDEEKLRKGEQIAPAILGAIGESRLSIVVFSKDYASSGWCLDELVRILECMDTMGQIVCPVFYEVDPSEVRNLGGRYGQALVDHEERLKLKGGDSEKVKRWREALTKAATIAGWHLVHESENRVIESIVEDVRAQLHPEQLHVPENVVSMDSHVSHKYTLLDMESNEVRMIGICGLGGIGKTTIPKAIYDAFLHKFGGIWRLPW